MRFRLWLVGLRFTVQWRPLAVLTAVAILAAGPALWFAGHAVDEEETRARESLALAAELAGRHADHIVVEAFFELEAVARIESAGAAGTFSEDEPLANFSAPIFLLNAEGEPLQLPDGWHGESGELSEIVDSAAGSDDRSVSPPFTSPVTGHPTSALGLPLFGNDGTREGTVVGFLDLEEHIASDLSETMSRFGSQGHADLIGPGGVILASTTHQVDDPGRHFDFYAGATEAGLAVVSDAVTSGPDGTPHVMAYEPLGAAPWGIAAGGARTDVYRSADDLRRLALRLAIPALVVLLIGFGLLTVSVDSREDGEAHHPGD
ncbi:MAG: cache domain-containing protein [Dehalococcoidia bacterium]